MLYEEVIFCCIALLVYCSSRYSVQSFIVAYIAFISLHFRSFGFRKSPLKNLTNRLYIQFHIPPTNTSRLPFVAKSDSVYYLWCVISFLITFNELYFHYFRVSIRSIPVSHLNSSSLSSYNYFNEIYFLSKR